MYDKGRCPECLAVIRVGIFAETVICPKCKAWFHPEHLLH